MLVCCMQLSPSRPHFPAPTGPGNSGSSREVSCSDPGKRRGPMHSASVAHCSRACWLQALVLCITSKQQLPGGIISLKACKHPQALQVSSPCTASILQPPPRLPRLEPQHSLLRQDIQPWACCPVSRSRPTRSWPAGRQPRHTRWCRCPSSSPCPSPPPRTTSALPPRWPWRARWGVRPPALCWGCVRVLLLQ